MPDAPRTRLRPRRTDPRRDPRTAVVWESLAEVLGDAREGNAPVLDVVDVGGGTGGLAVPIAGLGHRVTVVDPSPDALAALQRRVRDAGVDDLVRARQGDAGALRRSLGEGTADVVLFHGVLEYLDDPGAAVGDALGTLRPGGLVSLLVAQRLGAFLARAISGRFEEALRILETPDGSAGDRDPLPRRFDRASLLALFGDRPVRVRRERGVRLLTDLLPGAFVDGDPGAAEALLDLERRAGDPGTRPELAAVAGQLHLVLEVPAG